MAGFNASFVGGHGWDFLVWCHNAMYPTDETDRLILAMELAGKGLTPTQGKQHFSRARINKMAEAMHNGSFDWRASGLRPVILGPDGEVLGGHIIVSSLLILRVSILKECLDKCCGKRKPIVTPLSGGIKYCPMFRDLHVNNRPAKGASMGIESFRVELQGGHSSLQEVAHRITQLDNIHSDPQAAFMPRQLCYIARWQKAVIEVEILDSPIGFSCRMTLCHPAEANEPFLDFILFLMKQFHMDLRICDDNPDGENGLFSIDAVDVFSPLIIQGIISKREKWQRAFGSKEGRYTTEEVHRHIILPDHAFGKS